MIGLELPPFAFVVDTDKYAGNFERELVAYMTGRVGECEVGKECAKKYRSEVGEASDDVMNHPDEHGCQRPASIYINPDWWNDGEGNHFLRSEVPPPEEHWPAYYSVAAWLCERPSDETMKLWIARAKTFAPNPHACGSRFEHTSFNITGFRLVAHRVETDTLLSREQFNALLLRMSTAS